MRCLVVKSLFLFACFAGVISAQNYPFPQQSTYQHGIMPDGVNPKPVQQVYEVWLQHYYEESGNEARIRFDEPENTVSEGIAYGMLIMVFMDNEENNTRPKFDKLWNYYKNKRNGNGLMNWKISGFGGVIGSGAATDAELDAAVALIMADKQWGGSYLNEAKDLITKIGQHEVSGNLLKGGDQWDALNPSYMSMVATQLFQNLGGGNWGTIQDRCYQLLEASQHNITGMWPNWCDASGNPGGGTGSFPTIYGFDACRTPWRLGWAYVWYGHAKAKTLCGNIVDYFRSAGATGGNPANIGQQYNLDGSINYDAEGSEDNIPTYLGPLTVAGMVNTPYREWLNKGYTRLRAFNGSNDNYYNECLELLTMLLLTGNMPDFTSVQPKSSATLTVNVAPPSGGSVSVNPQKGSYSIGEQVTLTATSSDAARYNFVSWSGDYEGTNASATFKVTYDMTVTANFKDESGGDLVDDCEDNNGLTNMGSEWFTYTDVLDEGASTITPVTKKGEQQLEMTSGGYNSDYAVKIEYRLDKGNFEYDPFVGVGFELKEDSTAEDISMSTGLSFAYKGTFGEGDTCAIKCESEAVTELGASYSYTLPPSETWTEITLDWKTDFLQPKWAESVDLDLTVVPKIQWQIQGSTGESGELWLDDIHIIGFTVPQNTKSCPRAAVESGVHAPFECTRTGATVTVAYNLKKNGKVRLSLFDLTGREVRRLTGGRKDAGSHSVRIDLDERDVSNSCRIVRLVTDEGTYTERILNW